MSCDIREFVNREPQLTTFQAMAEGRAEARILLLHGPLGIGKTCMLHRLRAECRGADITRAVIDFQREDLYSADAVIHALREQIGGDFSASIGKEVLAIEQSLAIPVPLGATPRGTGGSAWPTFPPSRAGKIEAQIGDIRDSQVAIGEQIIQISHSQINLTPGLEPALIRRERLLRLNRAFRRALEALIAQQPVALLFDTCDQATQDVIAWIRRQLLDPIRNDALASRANLMIIVAGDPDHKRGVWLKEVAGWRYGVIASELTNLLPDAIRLYWVEKRGLDEATLPAVFREIGAPPQLMFSMANLTAAVPRNGHG